MGSDKSHTKLVLIADYFLVKQHLNERERESKELRRYTKTCIIRWVHTHIFTETKKGRHGDS